MVKNMNLMVAAIIAGVVAIILSILIFIYIMPKKRRDGLNGFFKWLSDLFNFRFLILEYIVKGLYVLCTVSSVCYGFFLLFSGYMTETYEYNQAIDEYYTVSHFHSYAHFGLLIMIAGPIAVRIAYELLMMFILVVKNTSEINTKMDKRVIEEPIIRAEKQAEKPENNDLPEL